MNQTHQVRVTHDSGIGYIASCPTISFKGKHHQKKSWALEEAGREFPGCKLVLHTTNSDIKEDVYLTVPLDHAKDDSPAEELLVTCPRCHAPNFTARGLRAHRCMANNKLQLPATEVANAAAHARADAQHAKIVARKDSPESQPAEKLQLLAPQSAAVEKEIAGRIKAIKLSISGNQRAGSLFFAYAAMAGAHANRLAEIVPHKELEKTLEAHFPEAARRTLYRWRTFATELIPTMGKSATVALLTAPVLGSKSIPAKVATSIQAAVMEVMDGKGMMEFMRDCKMLRELKAPGGYRPDKEKLAAWLAEHHPELAGKKWDELSNKVQHAFKKFIELQDRRVDTDGEAERADSLAGDTEEKILAVLNGKQKLRFTLERKQSLALLGQQLAEEMKKLTKTKSP